MHSKRKQSLSITRVDSHFSSDLASWPEIELSTYVSNNAAPTFSSFKNSLTSLSQAAVLDFGQEIATVYASLLDGQEPLGTEFEAVWDANVDQLYEA